MSNNAVNDSFTFNEKEMEKIIVIFFSIILFLVCIIAAVSILPESCSLFSDNIPGGFQCDGLTIPSVPCGCQDRRMASVASIIAGLGISVILLPFLVFAIRNRRNNTKGKAKIFD